ncbi:MAG: uL15 family ribosomal protein [Patescibacteria group bacterium]|nr:uL15 family ribosomal protein [Patescibacteria group bacterium]
MQIHTLKPNHPFKKSQQVGRGGHRGKTSGKGTKGQNARAGRKKRPELRDLIKKLPKLRGRGVNLNMPMSTKPFPVNLSTIEAVFANGDTVSPETLMKNGVIEMFNGKIPLIKILSEGELSKKISVSGGISVSAGAKTKIEKNGGMVSETAS